MRKTRLLIVLFLPLFLASFLQAQSLAELAKKEKERREALKGKGTTITKVDLAKVKLKPAVEAGGQAQAPEGQTGETAAQQETPPNASGQQAAEAPAGEKPAEEAPAADAAALTAQQLQKRQAELAAIAQDKADLVDLLTLKMNSLYQQFYNLDNQQTRELVQKQISETYDKLLKAEMESTKAKRDLEDFLAQMKRDQAPALWIR